MKIIVISDIHGDLVSLNEIIDKLYKFNIDKLIVLGDFCSYYSNSLDIADRLNDFKSMMIAVRGNSDNNEFINHLNIDLPLIRNITVNNHIITITHGHTYNEYHLPEQCGNIFLSGHTHRKKLEKINNIIIANPGSLGRPRDGSKSYILIDEKSIYLKNMQDNTIKSLNLND